MALGRPTVEMVTLRAEMPRAQREQMVRTAGTTLPRLERGSPMPMKTTLVMRGKSGKSTLRVEDDGVGFVGSVGLLDASVHAPAAMLDDSGSWPARRAGVPIALRRSQTCSMMRPAERLLSRPPRPEAQNLQPTGQPIWLEMQAVRRSSVGIITHSVWRVGSFWISVREEGRMLRESGVEGGTG